MSQETRGNDTAATGGARARARVAITAEIEAEARRQLAETGAGGLSLRAVARALGMASSAVYRYVASRDELLTTLIISAYDELGDTAEAAVTASAGQPGVTRWLSIARAVRTWAISHPNEWALLYGSPVPGYEAPETTTRAGTRVSRLLLTIVADDLTRVEPARSAQPSLSTVDEPLAGELRHLAEVTDSPLDPPVMARVLAAWTQLFGLVSFEVFGQTRGLVTEQESLFLTTAELMAEMIGLSRDA